MTRSLNLLVLAMGILFSTSAFAVEGDKDGDGILDGVDACPNDAGGGNADGCPNDAAAASASATTIVVDAAATPAVDTDGDGVPDDKDVCKDEADGSDTNSDGCPECKPEDGLSRCQKKETVDLAAAAVRAHVGKYHAVDSAQWTAIALLRAGTWNCEQIGALVIPDQARYYSMIWADVRQAQHICIAYAEIAVLREQLQRTQADVAVLQSHDVIAHPELLDYLATDAEVRRAISSATADLASDADIEGLASETYVDDAVATALEHSKGDLRLDLFSGTTVTTSAPYGTFDFGLGVSYLKKGLFAAGHVTTGVEYWDAQPVIGGDILVGGAPVHNDRFTFVIGAVVPIAATVQLTEEEPGQLAFRPGLFLRAGNGIVSGELRLAPNLFVRSEYSGGDFSTTANIVITPRIARF